MYGTTIYNKLTKDKTLLSWQSMSNTNNAHITIFRFLPNFQLNIAVQLIVQWSFGLPSMLLIQIWFHRLFFGLLLIINPVLSSRLSCKRVTKEAWSLKRNGYTAFSKCFWGAGYIKVGDGLLAEGNPLIAHRAPAYRGVRGHLSQEIFKI